jgi:hypothetical protein
MIHALSFSGRRELVHEQTCSRICSRHSLLPRETDSVRDATGSGGTVLTLLFGAFSLFIGIAGGLGFLADGWREHRWLGVVRGIGWLIAWALLGWLISAPRPWE